ncbi:MAG: HlyD family efflux transporter periplasmic adaptor subunit [Aquincola sp.]|nr:HlyD family efflux transporter periplasmic adaptor subunit [Aquincola sp.]MDH5329831.1 HlyD family efflux transporter periplasmic adaptor subunit [Aquincola sp.]
MKRKTWITLAAAAAGLALALAWAFAPRPVEVELAPVTQGRFEITIDEDGKTRLADRYVVSSPLAGRLSRITLREGDPVGVGLAVATLTPVLPALLDERTLRELRARLAAAQDNVQRSASRSERAKVALDQAMIEVRRSEQLAQQGFIAPTKLDADRLATQAAQRELEAAGAERRIAGHELEQASAALGAIQPGSTAAQRSFAVRAPVAGRVLRVLQTSEATVALGTPLIELGDTTRLEVVAELLTTDALAAQPGSRVRIERWGGPVDLEGRVRAVEPAAFTKVSALGVEEQRVRVLIDLTSPSELWQALGDGYRVGVRIVTLAQEGALQVPVSAVFPLPAGAATGNDAAHAVFVVDGGRARQVSVELGGRNGSAAWIRGGLALGQRVIVYPPASVRDGVRVSARTV